MPDDALSRLRAIVRGYESTVTAFSAGVDSTLVAVVAQQELGPAALAATAVSASLAPSELEDALSLARALGLNHRLVHTREVEDERYASNPIDRCYFCKTHLYTELEGVAAESHARYILNGLNVDDLGDWRPGAQAAAERADHVRSPLHEAGMGKAEIRAAARALGLPNWDKPALACLSSRVPYGQNVTHEKLERIGQAELALRQLGFRAACVCATFPIEPGSRSRQTSCLAWSPKVSRSVSRPTCCDWASRQSRSTRVDIDRAA